MSLQNHLIVYTGRLCSDCLALKAWLADKDISFEEREIREKPEHSRELVEAIGKEAVPYLLYRGEWIRGYQVGKEFDPAWCEELFAGLDGVAT
jgi:glutaredoxin